MRYTLRITVGAALLFPCLAGGSVVSNCVWAVDVTRAASPTKSSDSAASVAAELVRQALEAELAGDADKRTELLREALRTDPAHAASHWHRGELQIDGSWLPIDSLGQHFAADENLGKYRQLRAGLVDTADSQRELARWCDKRQLKPEARVHWMKLLEYEPSDAEAIKALDLRLYQGRLVTRKQIVFEQAQLAGKQRALREWQPRIASWRRDLTSDSSQRRSESLRELQAFNNHHAVGALEAAFGINSDNETAVDLNMRLIETLSRMPQDDVTRVLIRRAVESDSQAVRNAAASALKNRPPDTWLQHLLVMLPAQSETTTLHGCYVFFNGDVYRYHEVRFKDLESGTEHSFSLEDLDVPLSNQVPVKRVPLRISRFLSYSAATDAQLMSAQKQREQLRERVTSALKVATGIKQELSVSQWLQKADELTERYSPPQYNEQPQITSAWRMQIRRTASCFPEGTPVLTAMGPVAIDELRPGDQVVSQNVETGETLLQPVQRVTLRPAVPLVEIEAGGETIRATRGHPFWVNGEGWIMAKHLKVGQQLHTPDGPLAIDRIGEQPAQEAYNLVVSDFATYFVGPQKVLVHDNQPLHGTSILVPGLAAREVQQVQVP
jgi:hypothetical protein